MGMMVAFYQMQLDGTDSIGMSMFKRYTVHDLMHGYIDPVSGIAVPGPSGVYATRAELEMALMLGIEPEAKFTKSYMTGKSNIDHLMKHVSIRGRTNITSDFQEPTSRIVSLAAHRPPW